MITIYDILVYQADAGWRHALRSEWPFIIIIIRLMPLRGAGITDCLICGIEAQYF